MHQSVACDCTENYCDRKSFVWYCLCAREHLLARSMAFIVDDTIVYSHLVLLGAVAYFCGHFGLQIILSLKGSPCPDHYMQMHIRTPANTLKNHVALLRLIPMVAVSSPRSESWLNPLIVASSASTRHLAKAEFLGKH